MLLVVMIARAVGLAMRRTNGHAEGAAAGIRSLVEMTDATNELAFYHRIATTNLADDPTHMTGKLEFTLSVTDSRTARMADRTE